MKYFIANWKANKNVSEADQWLKIFSQNYYPKENVTIIIAPPYPFLHIVHEVVRSLKNVFVAAQDISMYEEGNYTGEVSAKSLKGLVDYSIVGHSERRVNFNETDETIDKKIDLAHKYLLKTILCIRDGNDKIINETEIVAYEPIGAIGTGENVSVENIIALKNKLSLGDSIKFLYGGSVSDKNVAQYLQTDAIDGLLVGGASLDPVQFLKLSSQV